MALRDLDGGHEAMEDVHDLVPAGVGDDGLVSAHERQVDLAHDQLQVLQRHIRAVDVEHLVHWRRKVQVSLIGFIRQTYCAVIVEHLVHWRRKVSLIGFIRQTYCAVIVEHLVHCGQK